MEDRWHGAIPVAGARERAARLTAELGGLLHRRREDRGEAGHGIPAGIDDTPSAS